MKRQEKAIEKIDKADNGQTLGYGGVGEGCYLVLPVLGPSTVRDAFGSLANFTGGDLTSDTGLLAFRNIEKKN